VRAAQNEHSRPSCSELWPRWRRPHDGQLRGSRMCRGYPQGSQTRGEIAFACVEVFFCMHFPVSTSSRVGPAKELIHDFAYVVMIFLARRHSCHPFS
jgi:hypothetical protein